jgi:hypothetical protein
VYFSTRYGTQHRNTANNVDFSTPGTVFSLDGQIGWIPINNVVQTHLCFTIVWTLDQTKYCARCAFPHLPGPWYRHPSRAPFHNALGEVSSIHHLINVLSVLCFGMVINRSPIFLAFCLHDNNLYKAIDYNGRGSLGSYLEIQLTRRQDLWLIVDIFR